MAELNFRLPAFEDRETEPPRPKRRVMILGSAAAVAIGGLLTALYLGSLGYDIRRNRMHEARLKGILVQTPTVYQVTEGLKEKAPLALIVESENDLEQAVARWGMKSAAEIRSKASRWPQLRVYDAGDMIYFIYYDESDIMKDYIYVSAET